MPSLWPASAVETSIFFPCMQTRPHAVTRIPCRGRGISAQAGPHGFLKRRAEFGRRSHVERLVGAFVVERADEPVEAVPLLVSGHVGRAYHLFQQRQMHALMRAVPLGMAGPDALDLVAAMAAGLATTLPGRLLAAPALSWNLAEWGIAPKNRLKSVPRR